MTLKFYPINTFELRRKYYGKEKKKRFVEKGEKNGIR